MTNMNKEVSIFINEQVWYGYNDYCQVNEDEPFGFFSDDDGTAIWFHQNEVMSLIATYDYDMQMVTIFDHAKWLEYASSVEDETD